MSPIASTSFPGKRYLFWIRPVDGSRDGLPKDWWLPWALGPLATLEASKDGLRIIRRSWRGGLLQFVVGLAVAFALMVGLWPLTVILISRGLGVSYESAILGFVLAGLLVTGIALLLSPYIRKLAAWRPKGPFVKVEVISASLGSFHQELHIEGDGQGAWVRTNARYSTITAALRLAHQMPRESDAIR